MRKPDILDVIPIVLSKIRDDETHRLTREELATRVLDYDTDYLRTRKRGAALLEKLTPLSIPRYPDVNNFSRSRRFNKALSRLTKVDLVRQVRKYRTGGNPEYTDYYYLAPPVEKTSDE